MVQSIHSQFAPGTRQWNGASSRPTPSPVLCAYGLRSSADYELGGRRNSFSREAKSLRQIVGAIAGGSDIRSDLVEQLRVRIANCTYEVDAQLIARRLLTDGPGE
jgi:hypothetical protein